MKYLPYLFIGLLSGGFLSGCATDEIDLPSPTSCNATYVIDDTNRVCVYGDCTRYDDILRERRCPRTAPLCQKDENGAFYCSAK